MQYCLFESDPSPPRRAKRNDIRNGDAAEAYVLAKLLRWGFDAHDSRRDATYDIVVDLGDGRVCRIQVKGCDRARRGRWSYGFRRGNPRTGTGSYAYAKRDFDIAACVALSLEKVLFFPEVCPSIRLSTADFKRDEAERQSWDRALEVIKRTSSNQN